MLDATFVREHEEAIRKAVADKGIDLDVDALLAADTARRDAISGLDDARATKNRLNQQMKGGKPSEDLLQQAGALKEEVKRLEELQRTAEEAYKDMAIKIPMYTSPETPVGASDAQNVETKTWGEKPDFDFEPKDHIELGTSLDVLDFERGVNTSGFRGYYVKGDGVLLMMAFLNYAMQKLVAKGFEPMLPPTLVKEFALKGTGYFKGREYDANVDEVYKVNTAEGKEEKFLVGTAEPSLLAYWADEVLDVSQLPKRVCGLSPCYRTEIGSYSKDVKGLYRVHEFWKVEMVGAAVADVDEAQKLHSELIATAEELHQDLGLPYRLLEICTGDMSAGKYRAVDIEAWMPGRGSYGETGSASNFLEWQAARLNVRYEEGDEKKLCYLLNGTALPTPRIFIAILENYQQADGSVKIPEALVPFMMGKTEIRPKN